MKHLKHLLSFLLTAILILCSMSIAVHAELADQENINDPHLQGGEFVQGIGNVTCISKVDVSLYPELYAAIHAAILDWDWHLNILNEQFQVNWNITDITGKQTYGMIEFCTMNRSQATDLYHSRFPEANDTSISESAAAFTTWRDGSSPINSLEYKWTAADVVFLWDNLLEGNHLYDYNYLKKVANHEIGHALGLADQYEDNGVIMYYAVDENTANVATAFDLVNIYCCYQY